MSKVQSTWASQAVRERGLILVCLSPTQAKKVQRLSSQPAHQPAKLCCKQKKPCQLKLGKGRGASLLEVYPILTRLFLVVVEDMLLRGTLYLGELMVHYRKRNAREVLHTKYPSPRKLGLQTQTLFAANTGKGCRNSLIQKTNQLLYKLSRDS